MSDPYVDNVVLALPFDQDGLGNWFFDYSKIHQAIQAVGDCSLSATQVKYGDKSAFLSAASDYFQILSATVAITNQDFTVDGWFYLTSLSVSRGLFFNGAHPAQASDFISGQIRTDGLVRFWSAGSVGTWDVATATGAVTINTWTHIAFNRSGSTLTIFINGISVATGTKSAGTTATGNYFRIGHAIEYGTNSIIGIIGYVDDFRVTLGVARYSTDFTPPLAFKADYPAVPTFSIKITPTVYRKSFFQWCLLDKKSKNITAFYGKSFLQWSLFDKKVIIKPSYFKKRLATNVWWGGTGTITGIVDVGAIPVKRRVRLYESKTGVLLWEQWSGDDGTYTFTTLSKIIDFTVSSVDHTGVYNDVIAARIRAI